MVWEKTLSPGIGAFLTSSPSGAAMSAMLTRKMPKSANPRATSSEWTRLDSCTGLVIIDTPPCGFRSYSLGQPARGFLFHQRIEHGLEICFLYDLGGLEFHVEPLIGDNVVLIAVDADFFASASGTDLALALRGSLGVDAVPLDLKEPGSEQTLGLLAILGLALRFLHADLDASRLVDHVDGCGDLVDVLTARPLCSGDVLFDVVGPVDVHIDVFRLGEGRDGGGRCVDPALGLGRGHPFDGVDAGLEAEFDKDALAFDRDDRVTDAAHAGVCGQVHLVEGPALLGGVLAVHVEEVSAPEPGLVAPRAGAEFEDDRAVLAVVGGDERGLDVLGELAGLAENPGQFILREFRKLGVVAFDRGLEFLGFFAQPDVLAPGPDNGAEGGALDREIPDRVVVRHDRGVAELFLEVVVLGVHLAELVNHGFGEERLKFCCGLAHTPTIRRSRGVCV